jgi:hypothetical protein
MAQKAYSPDRYMHEAIINTVETIKHCQRKNVDGVLLSVDLHKAFDSVLHEFMREVYKFFGFGEYFIKMSEALGNGRSAKIILENGSYSAPIELYRCRPQGDSPSPRQFNMCQQICIFKIELDPEIRSVYLTFVVPRTMGRAETEADSLATDEEVQKAEEKGYNVIPELRHTKRKVGSFADDLSASVMAEYETLSRVKSALLEFGIISGLRTNVEKTTMMRIGNLESVLDPRIRDLGFAMVDEMKILGFLIDNKAEHLERNFDVCITKMRKIVGNWSRFRLTLPGRIAIAKSMILSQVTFHGTILEPTTVQLRVMNEIIEGFVTHNIVISKERMYVPVKKGGLGLINLENFLAAQKCSWIRRCFLVINDPWRWDFLRMCNYSLSTVRIENFSKVDNPMLWTIANAVSTFQKKYWLRDENYLEAPIFNNDFVLSEKPRPRAEVPGPVDVARIRRNHRNVFYNELLALKIKSLFVDGQIVDFNNFVRSTGLPLNGNEYMGLVTAALYARERYGNKPVSNGKNVCIVEAVYSKKGGSKKFRRYFADPSKNKEVTDLQTVKTFYNLVGLQVPDRDVCGVLNSIWNYHHLPNNVRYFAFQFVNNSLPTGNRLMARYRNNPERAIDGLCTFCRIQADPDPARESFVHVFYMCPHLQNCLSRYFDKYYAENLDDESKRKILFTGTADGDWSRDTEINSLLNMIFCCGIWFSKLGKKVPSFTTIEENMLTIFDSCLYISTSLAETATTSLSPICRLWRNRNGRG